MLMKNQHFIVSAKIKRAAKQMTSHTGSSIIKFASNRLKISPPRWFSINLLYFVLNSSANGAITHSSRKVFQLCREWRGLARRDETPTGTYVNTRISARRLPYTDTSLI